MAYARQKGIIVGTRRVFAGAGRSHAMSVYQAIVLLTYTTPQTRTMGPDTHRACCGDRAGARRHRRDEQDHEDDERRTANTTSRTPPAHRRALMSMATREPDAAAVYAASSTRATRSISSSAGRDRCPGPSRPRTPRTARRTTRRRTACRVGREIVGLRRAGRLRSRRRMPPCQSMVPRSPMNRTRFSRCVAAHVSIIVASRSGKLDVSCAVSSTPYSTMAESAGPRANSRRLHSGRIEQRIQQVCPVVEQDPAGALGRDGPPRLRALSLPRIGRWAIDRELGQVPPANRVVAKPGQHLLPRRVVPVLVAGHDDALCAACGGGDRARLVACESRLVSRRARASPWARAQSVVAEMGARSACTRRRNPAGRSSRGLREPGRPGCPRRPGAPGAGSTAATMPSARAQCRVVPEPGQVGVPRHPAEPDQRATIARRGLPARDRARSRPRGRFRQWEPLAVSVGGAAGDGGAASAIAAQDRVRPRAPARRRARARSRSSGEQ